MLLAWVGKAGVEAAHPGANTVTRQMFDKLDMNKDEMISEEELQAWEPDSEEERAKRVRLSTIFAQSDINDDGALSFEEFHFAGFLANQDLVEKNLARHAGAMPAGFRQDIHRMFDSLRRDYPGKVSMRQFGNELRYFLLNKFNEELDDVSYSRLQDLFNRADIIPDGNLNMNELDYFEFLVEDAMIRAAAEATRLARMQEQEVNTRVKRLQEAMMTEFDEDRNGRLSKGEVVRGIRRAFDVEAAAAATLDESVEQIEAGESIAEVVRQRFAECDRNGDGELDRTEIASLLDLIKSFVT